MTIHPDRESSPGPAQWSRPFPETPAVNAVLFDYGLTLVHFARPNEALAAAQEAIADCIEAAGHARPPAALMAAAVHDRVAAEVATHEAGGALEEIDVVALERRAFADLGWDLDDEVLDRCSALTQQAWRGGVHLYADTLHVIGALRSAGLRVGVCSNAAYRPASMRDQLRHLGLDAVLDAAVFSGDIGWRKPSPRLFAAALDAVGASAANTVFVGDRVREDVAGASDAGMRTVLVVRDAATASAPRLHEPDAVIGSLSELLSVLRCQHL